MMGGMKLLTEFRQEMFEQIKYIVNGFPEKAFYQMPYANAKGYHSKTLAYSVMLSTNVMNLKPVQKVFTLRKMMVQMRPRRRRCI